MALQIKLSPTFWWPVSVTLPAADGCQTEAQTFEVEFARIKVSEANTLVDEIINGKRPEIDGFRELVKGWRGVLSDNEEVPFTDGALQALLEIPSMGPAIILAFREANSGQARTKN